MYKKKSILRCKLLISPKEKRWIRGAEDSKKQFVIKKKVTKKCTRTMNVLFKFRLKNEASPLCTVIIHELEKKYNRNSFRKCEFVNVLL